MSERHGLRSQADSEKKFVKLDDKGKKAEEVASGSSDPKKLVTEFINSIDAQIKKEFPITVSTDAKNQVTLLKSQVKSYRENLIKLKEKFLNYQTDSDQLSYIQKIK